MDNSSNLVEVDSPTPSYKGAMIKPSNLDAFRQPEAVNLSGGRLNSGLDRANASIKPEVPADTIVRVAYKFNTPVTSPNGVINDPIGFVHYVDEMAEQANRVIYLDFWLEDNLTVEEVILRERFYDGIDNTGTNYQVDNVSTYLNPTRTQTTSTITSTDIFYRYSGGTKLIDKYDPTGDLDEYEYKFSRSDIDAIDLGNWNSIVLQQDTEDTSFTNFGFATIDLLITGYLTY